MNAPFDIQMTRRQLLKAGGALVVALGLPLSARATEQVLRDKSGNAQAHALIDKTLDAGAVDGYIAIHQDGTVTLFSGKVDLGQGLRIAIRQMAAEELGIAVDKIEMIEGDTALTPDQGPTAGSSGVMRGGVQIRQAAATAREALILMAAARLQKPASELMVQDGVVRPKAGGAGLSFAELVGGKRFDLKVDAKAPLNSPQDYRVVGKPLLRPDVPAKVTGTHVYVHDVKLPGMLHGRVIRPAGEGARIVLIDESSVRSFPGVRVVRIGDFLGVAAPDEWDAMQAAAALKVVWSDSDKLMGHDKVEQWLRSGPFDAEETLVSKGDAAGVLQSAAGKLSASYYWPPQTHGSIGPSCAVADVGAKQATIYTASQGTHRYRPAYAQMLGLPNEAVRLVYVDGAGCYGMNGHDDAAADAALMSKTLGKPVRVQWSRQDEHGFDPKGPPQALTVEGALGPGNTIAAWRTEMWLPRATASLPTVPLLAPQTAGMPQPKGISTGLISQNGDPPYDVANVSVGVHWHDSAPLRPANIRAPGKIANIYAVECFTDELAAQAGMDPLAFRLQSLKDARGAEVLKRTASLFGWQSRAASAGAVNKTNKRGRGIAYSHYKHNETYVAMAMEVEVDRGSGGIRVLRVACAHDCGLIINPDGLRAQVEGSILQTISRSLYEEIRFDRRRVQNVDWASYPILAFPAVPEVRIELIDRPTMPPLGGGEAAASPVTAALANAVWDAVGIRLRTVPFTPERVKAALANA
ncbi:molybdopterin cofactor-binding domain-containing protein [Herbaspirillum sp. RV1423]|uniref:xanthine dehydrogenase family protein molybdopterin-binding subunit n=1 Tax=Herbaspirillum sp. RV1423 TaxID=1443993 RepID=UPI0004B4B9FA|nr:molybdopterin cofactor-binding domain-containing protein [Herbaspirillum sp. RV1423]